MLPAWYRSFHKAALAQEGHMPGTIGRRELIAGLFGAAATWPLGALAQPAGKKYTIGYLSAGSLVLVEATAAFTDALRKLGWIEGKNVAFERPLRGESARTAR
jgi:hypothetical protein